MGGRELLSTLHAMVLKDLFGSDFSIFIVPESRDNPVSKLSRGIRGLVDGLSNIVFRDITTQIRRDAITIVFIDGSNLGLLAKHIKCSLPDVEVVTFYHNIETRFFWGSLCRCLTVRAFFVFVAHLVAEFHATRHSDRLICLNKRDSELLHRYFNRRASHICPLAIRRPDTTNLVMESALPAKPYALFVGGAFYANLQGIEWYNQHIAPHLDIPLYIIGHGLKTYFKNRQLSAQITLLGSVNYLEPWYLHSAFVIAPIFDGSGMKTKVAEALMYGKKIVGTPEAFIGYESALPCAGWCCSTPKEFLNACISATSAYLPPSDTKLVSIYKTNYSPEASFSHFSRIFRA